jgi:hypothetical protein
MAAQLPGNFRTALCRVIMLEKKGSDHGPA